MAGAISAIWFAQRRCWLAYHLVWILDLEELGGCEKKRSAIGWSPRQVCRATLSMARTLPSLPVNSNHQQMAEWSPVSPTSIFFSEILARPSSSVERSH